MLYYVCYSYVVIPKGIRQERELETMNNTLTIPTTSAIETAIKNANRDAKNYRLNDLLASDGMWLVVGYSCPSPKNVQ